jgi:hypothetical protein
MAEEREIVNRVATSALITLDLEALRPAGDRVELDIKDQLFQGLMLREKDFREYIKTTDWSQYQNQWVTITCSVDAIVPTWAYMLLTIALEPHAKGIFFGSLERMEEELFKQVLDSVDWTAYQGAKVVVKGCSKEMVPVTAYVEAARRLRPLTASMMFGEPCSTVPLYKKR